MPANPWANGGAESEPAHARPRFRGRNGGGGVYAGERLENGDGPTSVLYLSFWPENSKNVGPGQHVFPPAPRGFLPRCRQNVYRTLPPPFRRRRNPVVSETTPGRQNGIVEILFSTRVFNRCSRFQRSFFVGKLELFDRRSCTIGPFITCDRMAPHKSHTVVKLFLVHCRSSQKRFRFEPYTPGSVFFFFCLPAKQEKSSVTRRV